MACIDFAGWKLMRAAPAQANRGRHRRGYAPGVTATRVAAVALVLATATTGCFGGDGDGATAVAIPEAELREAGSLAVCSDTTRPPLEYRASDGVLRGFEVDLVEEIAGRHDLEVEWVETARAEIVDALVAGRCDAAASTFAVRRDGGTLGRVAATAYLSTPVSLLVGPDARLSVVANGLCGLRVGAFPATLEHDVLEEHGAGCPANGRRLSIVAVASTPEALEALRAGRLDAVLAEHPVNDWFARRQTDRFDLVWVLGGDVVVRWAIASAEGKTELYAAIRATLRELHADGTFDVLLERWRLERTGVVALPIP